MCEDEVVDYYCDQLHHLVGIAQMLEKRALFVDANLIMDDSETVLQSVQ